MYYIKGLVRLYTLYVHAMYVRIDVVSVYTVGPSDKGHIIVSVYAVGPSNKGHIIVS